MTYDEILTRARSAIGHGITYHLGHGGLHPADPLPSRDGQCDCSGFVAWVLGRSRNPATAPKLPAWPWWLSTDSVFADANGANVLFTKLDHPVPGCLAVYADWKDPDGKHHEGHIAVVADPAKHTVVDCSDSGHGVTEHVQPVFWSGHHPVTFCQLKAAA